MSMLIVAFLCFAIAVVCLGILMFVPLSVSETVIAVLVALLNFYSAGAALGIFYY